MSIGDALARLKQALEDHGCAVHGTSAQCPAHDDQHASLSLGQGRKGALLRCHAGCGTDEVLEALGMSAADLFDEPDEPRTRGRGYEVVATYEYTDEHGVPLFYVERREPKGFRQYRIVNRKKVWNLGGVRLVLYRLPEVVEAVKNGETIWLTEGEKDAEALRAAGAVATTCPMGAGRWRDQYSEVLRGACVVIIADRDEAGRSHARQVAASLAGVAASVRIVEAAEGKDAYDHLSAGHGLDDFRDPEPEQTPPPQDSTTRMTAIAAAYTPLDWAALLGGGQPPPVQWLIEPVLESGTVNAMFSRVGIGKSLLAFDWAVCLARAGTTVMYVDEENPQVFIAERARAFGASAADLSARLPYYSFASLPPLDTAEGGDHLEALAVSNSAALVILDTTTRMVRGGENDSDTFLALFRCSLVPLKKRGITVLRLDHPGKDESKGQRGSSAKDGDVDTIWRLTEVQANQQYRLVRLKNRGGRAPEYGELEITRHHQPRLRHEALTAVARAVQALDDLGILPTAGRPACGQALRAAGYTVGNDVLDQAIRIRKDGAKLPGANWGIGGQ